MFIKMVEMLYFTASWCSPCKAMAPFIAELQREGRIIKKIDVDQERALADQYQVRAMPTFIMMRDGKEVHRMVGARDKFTLDAEFRMAETIGK
jgi:thioredoxin 1